MSSVILCASPMDGHIAPMLGVAAFLRENGHRVRFLTGARYESAVRRTGAEFLALPAESDLTDDAIEAGRQQDGERVTGPKAMALNIKRIFLDPAAGQYRTLLAAIAAEHTDAVLAENAFVGAAALALSSAEGRPAVIACGVLPLGLCSVDTAPFGLGLPPRSDLVGRLRNRFLNAAARHVILRVPQKQAERTVRELTGNPLDVFFTDWTRYADHFAQFTVPGFEYPRRDLPSHVHFLGPAARLAPAAAALPDWWHELDGSRPVVHVTQGTIANDDLDELILPTIRALADEDVLVVVSTGGRPVEALGVLPANVRAAEFLPYDRLMPLIDVFVSNGGYGGLHFALEHGVPIVAAGDIEDKLETTARVAWSGVGVNLKTGTPTDAAVGAAVRTVLNDGSYRRHAERIRDEIAASQGVAGIVPLIEQGRRLPSEARGGERRPALHG
ncbi:nucleotide disphospho-sugar-binding domain-containing protein [Rathayibacter sp. YIM 133350]|uniref:glycosyltransferase n=1 Tax=Rathayibacter sp. YIM 133350 TaxID=3131992 RepID=UPI00307D4D53